VRALKIIRVELFLVEEKKAAKGIKLQKRKKKGNLWDESQKKRKGNC